MLNSFVSGLSLEVIGKEGRRGFNWVVVVVVVVGGGMQTFMNAVKFGDDANFYGAQGVFFAQL